MRLSFDNLYALISPEFFGVSEHIKGSNRFKKLVYFRQLQLIALGSEISLPLFVWSNDPNKLKRALMVNFDVVCTKMAETIGIELTESNQKCGQFSA
jgi:hypothetical protein